MKMLAPVMEVFAIFPFNSSSLPLDASAVAVPDSVAGPEPNPLWDGPVLFLRLRQLLLSAERLVRLYGFPSAC